MSFFKHLKDKFSEHHHSSSSTSSHSAPPQWTPAPEISHAYGKWNEAPGEEYDAAEQFCKEYPPQLPQLLPSNAVERIGEIGCKAWGIEYPISPRFIGNIKSDFKGGPGVTTVQTGSDCKDVTLLSDLPIMAGLYDIHGKTGVYFEILIRKMEGIIAIGTSCRPYPAWRLPGWNRLSAGFHLDDFRKFFEDGDGGRDYTDAIGRINDGDTIGCGYEFATGVLFYTYNGMRLPNAFTGIYMPRQKYDVFAAIGVEGGCDFQVNFGGDHFRWKEGNEWAWRVEGHVGKLNGSSSAFDEDLPSYETQVR
ncbi:hypothetical protein K443DRAFT_671446 [Laccaria amethystina LaAM-08-1]|uniref:B30.2/SPRY domain-containing protein n=1 Tax=Laccaria amethystina LaAM-08-1 TaxID=1095629 RepID=A0A0C9YNK0_9AGAR|nr:hypothetical protein K443DRAFT_671446 [Laccaria amethystina LaAM-08-1]